MINIIKLFIIIFIIFYFINILFKSLKNYYKELKFKTCLKDMKKILDDNNQEFFLIYGTLLGYYRENAFIKHDEDIDLGILYSKFNPNIKTIILNSNKFKFKKSYGKINQNYELTFTHNNGVNIDLFVHYHENKNNYITSTFGSICDEKPEKYCKYRHKINGFKKIKFYNIDFLIPENTLEYLIEHYGDDWDIPKKMGYVTALKTNGYKNLIN
jgi:phosphorylcholine metabolism protein LicD